MPWRKIHVIGRRRRQIWLGNSNYFKSTSQRDGSPRQNHAQDARATTFRLPDSALTTLSGASGFQTQKRPHAIQLRLEFAPEQRQSVVAKLTFRRRCVCFET